MTWCSKMQGMCILTLSASVPFLKPQPCLGSNCKEASFIQISVFFTGLYLIALGTGGIKPCVSSFGADQFDDTDPVERVKKTSFFNWFYFAINIGALISSSLLVYVQDNYGWGIGFGIPTLFMALAVGSFFSGMSLYRFQKPDGGPLTRICQVMVASIRKWSDDVPQDISVLYEVIDTDSTIKSSRKLEHTNEMKFLDKAATMTYLQGREGTFPNPWRLCTVTQVEELKIMVRMFPIWATGIVFSAVYAQMSTMFVEQGMLLDTKIDSLTIPPASLSSFDVGSVVLWVPLYDRILVPLARKITGKQRGITQLQRMGIGLFISILSMSAAAILEIKRLEIAAIGGPPISIFWQVPQYVLIGASEIFTFIGQLEFFYDQSPDSMRSLCAAFSLMTNGLGNYLSSFILTVVTCLTTRGGQIGWIPDDLNEGHLDYFFWLLAGLSLLNLVMYIYFAIKFQYKKAIIV